MNIYEGKQPTNSSLAGGLKIELLHKLTPMVRNFAKIKQRAKLQNRANDFPCESYPVADNLRVKSHEPRPLSVLRKALKGA